MIDYYAEARRLAGLLRQEGLETEAISIEDAIDAGFTATEILMAIRFHLEQAAQKVNPIVSKQIESLVEEINKALG